VAFGRRDNIDTANSTAPTIFSQVLLMALTATKVELSQLMWLFGKTLLAVVASKKYSLLRCLVPALETTIFIPALIHLTDLHMEHLITDKAPPIDHPAVIVTPPATILGFSCQVRLDPKAFATLLTLNLHVLSLTSPLTNG